MKYTERVMDIVTGAISEMEQFAGQLEGMTRLFKANQITDTVFKEQKEELEKQQTAVRMDAAQKLQDTGKAYREAVEKGFEIDSTMLHDDAKLLQLDMKMTAHQFEALVEKHKSNPLMCQLLVEYSNKHEGLYTGFIPTVEAKAAAFDDFVGAAMNTIRTPSSLSAGLFLDGKYTPQFCTESE